MRKRLLATFLAVLMLLGTIPVTIAFASSSSATLTVKANKETVNPGDEVEFSVELSQTGNIAAIEAYINLPDGLTLVNGSFVAKTDKSTLGWDDFTTEENYLMIYGYGSVGYEGTIVTLVSFKCVVDSDAENGLTVDVIDISALDASMEDKYPTSVSATLNVIIPVSNLALHCASATVETGDGTFTLTPVFTPDNAGNQNVSWKSSDESVATVADGVVTLLKKGSVTITATSEDGGFEASCALTVNCSHGTSHNVTAEASTCIAQGHGAYTVCDECGEIISGSDAKLPLGDHAYIENADAKYLASAATCNKAATYYKSCSVCGAVSAETFDYGTFDAANHTGMTYKVNLKEATCYETGYTGDTYCSDCNTKISSGTVIEKNAHDPASIWSTDADYHWHDCQTIGCGNLIGKAPHTGGEATCINNAVCSVCHVQYGSVNPNNHKNTEIRDQKDATCCEDGYTGDTYCKDCGVKIADGTAINATGNHIDADGLWETDGTQHWHTCSYGTKFDITSHIGGTATCKDKAVCSVCGVSYGSVDTTNHVGETEIRNSISTTCSESGYTGDTYCKDCNSKISNGMTIPALGHDIIHHDAKAATCTEKGWNAYDTCSRCDYSTYSEIPALGHNYGTVVTNPTCTEQGYTTHTCSRCQDSFVDTYKPALGHTVVIDKAVEPTCTKTGLTEGKHCSVCNTVLIAQSVVPVTGHTIVNGKCSVCGYQAQKVNFPDVSYSAWYGDAVAYAVGAGLMKGYGSGKFGTADGIQRQDFVVILSRLSGDDLSQYEGKTSFKDVAKGAYYATALAWAKDKGVSSGYANGKFGVGDKVTREQIMVFLYNYAKLKGYDTSATLTEAQAKATYADFGEVSGYAKEAALWALSKGVVSGKDAGGGKKLIAPNLNALRCEVAGMFYNIEQKNIFQ